MLNATFAKDESTKCQRRMSFAVFRPSKGRDGYRQVASDNKLVSDDEDGAEMVGLVNADLRERAAVHEENGSQNGLSITSDESDNNVKKNGSFLESSEEPQTVEQVIDAIGFGKFQLRISTLVGFAIIADSMEILTLTILAPALHCDMHLRAFQQAMLTSVVFGGMMIGASAFGSFCDRYGRKAVS